MRGQPFTIPVPLSGFRSDLPPHLTPPNALVAGANVYIGQDGLLHPRSGYSALLGATNTSDVFEIVSMGVGFDKVAGVSLAFPTSEISVGDEINISGNSQAGYNGTWTVLNVESPTLITFQMTVNTINPGFGGTLVDQSIAGGIGARINGGFAFQDQDQNFQYVVNTDNQWWALGDIGVTWDNVSGDWSGFVGDWDDFNAFFGWNNITNPLYPLVGEATDPGRYAVFFEGGLAWLVGVDNFSVPVTWNSTLGEYTAVNYSPYPISSISGDGTTATLTLGAAVTNISIGDSITIAGNTNNAFNVSTTVANVLNGTTLTFASTEDGSGTGGTLTDTTTIAMPPARDITVIANRMVIVNTVENGTRYPHRVRWSAEGDFTRWPVLAYNDILDMEDDPIVGIQPLGQNLGSVLGQNSIFLLEAEEGDDANAFGTYRLQSADKYSGPASPAALISAEGLQYWLSYDGRVRQFDGVNVSPISPPIDAALQAAFDPVNASKCHAAYLQSERQVLFFAPTTSLTDVTDDPSFAVVLDLYRQVFLPFYTFSEGVTASFSGQVNNSITWINIQGTWSASPYTWEDVPNELETDTIIATASGEVDAFFRGVQDGDNLYDVAYNATWTYFFDPVNVIKFQYAEFYFEPVTGAVGGIEYVTMQFQTLNYPYDPGTPLVSFAASMQAGWTNQPVEPGPLNPNNVSNNLIAMTLSSSESKGGAGFAGGVLYGFLVARGQYGTGT